MDLFDKFYLQMITLSYKTLNREKLDDNWEKIKRTINAIVPIYFRLLDEPPNLEDLTKTKNPEENDQNNKSKESSYQEQKPKEEVNDEVIPDPEGDAYVQQLNAQGFELIDKYNNLDWVVIDEKTDIAHKLNIELVDSDSVVPLLNEQTTASSPLALFNPSLNPFEDFNPQARQINSQNYDFNHYNNSPVMIYDSVTGKLIPTSEEHWNRLANGS